MLRLLRMSKDFLKDIWSEKKIEKTSIEFQSEIVRKGKRAIKITVNKIKNRILCDFLI